MSRVGNKLIRIPQTVKIYINNNNLSIEGNLGRLEFSFFNIVQVTQIKNILIINRVEETVKAKAYHGLCRAIIQNMILGVTQGFTKILIVEGVGYKFQNQENNLILHMGYTHPVIFAIPKGISILIENLTKITIKGLNKEHVGLFADKIRAVRPPEPYKGKGIRYDSEFIIKKAGKNK